MIWTIFWLIFFVVLFGAIGWQVGLAFKPTPQDAATFIDLRNMNSNAKKAKDGSAPKFTNHDRATAGQSSVVEPSTHSSALAPGSQNELELTAERYNAFLRHANRTTGVQKISAGLGKDTNTSTRDGLAKANAKLMDNMRENC